MAAPDELSAIIMVMPAPPLPFLPPALHGKTVIFAMLAYAGGAAAAQAALAPLRSLATPLADLVGPAPFSSMYLPEDPTMRPALAIRSNFTGHFGLEQAERALAAVDRCDAPARMAQIRVLGGAMARIPSEATAFAHRQSAIMTTFLALYGNPADADRHDAWAAEALAELSGSASAWHVNFLGDEGQARLRASYPGQTWVRLQQAKHRYDPDNLFRQNQNIPPSA